MDFPVEATVHLNQFGNERQAQKILLSHGFQLTDLGGRRFRVQGSFSQLKAAKSQLELLVQDQPGSSGTVSRFHDDAGSRSGSRSRLREQRVSPTDAPSRSPQRSPTRPGRETMVIDSDVFKYADRLRKKEMEDILTRHTVSMTVQESGGSSSVTIRGPNSGTAAHKLQSLLDHLGKSLRTQEVPGTAMDRDGDAFLQRIQQCGNVYKSVLVRETKDGLLLVGPPKESFELQQQLMGNSAGRGRSYKTGSRLRSSSLPTTLRKNQGQRATDNSPPPGGAAGYSPPGNPDDSIEAERKARRRQHWFSFRRRSHLDTRQKKQTDQLNDASLDRRDTRPNPTTPTSNNWFNWFRKKKHRK